ncbi:hypothetical protein ACOSQ4_009119 [Xanthoceras sorbifolium]
MERKSCCGSSRSYVPTSSCVSKTTPKKEATTTAAQPVMTVAPKKEENVKKSEVTTQEKVAQVGVHVIQTPKTEEEKQQQAMNANVKQEETVKVNAGK